jgi:hypothetical protein
VTATGSNGGDLLEQRRREVEQARADLTRSIDELSTRAVATRDQTLDRVRQVAVPVAIGVAGFLVARALRRRRRRGIFEIGPFAISQRR